MIICPLQVGLTPACRVKETVVARRDLESAFLAHDLSQLLWAIQGRARALCTRVDAASAADLARIAEDAAAAADMLADAGSSGGADPVAVAAAAWRQAGDRTLDRGADVGGVEFSGPATAPPVAMPSHTLRRILGNLFANAVDAMPDGGRLSWDAALAGDTVTITVRDDGPGIADALRPRLFDVGATAGKIDGHGLGLAGARALARRWGGDLVGVKSARGAVFALTVPQATDRPAGEVETDGSGAEAEAPLRILAVDDEAPVREMLADLLASEGHHPTVAADHDSALAKFRTGDYDAALIDLGLPGHAGSELAGALRALDPALAIIVITGWGREQELDALDPGHVDLTGTKPLDLPQLRRLLTRAAVLTARRRTMLFPEE